MKPFNSEKYQQLLNNGASKAQHDSIVPVAKLDMTDETWLITHIDPEQPDIAYGLRDKGLGYVEYSTLNLVELRRNRQLRYIEHDEFFQGQFPIGTYKRAAEHYMGIVTDVKHVERFQSK